MIKTYIQQELIKLYHKSADDIDIDLYLFSENIPKEEHDALKATVKAAFLEEIVKTEPRKNLIRFVIWASAFVFTFILFFWIIPGIKPFKSSFVLAATGGVVLSVLLVPTLAFLNTWTSDWVIKNGKVHFNRLKENLALSITLRLVVAAVFSYFALNAFNAGKLRILKNNHLMATGKIMSGVQRIGGYSNYTGMSVFFTTKDGTPMTVVVEPSGKRFNEAYLDQKVSVIYYPEDPSVNLVLLEEDDLKEFTHSEERDFRLDDMFALMNYDRTKLTEHLDSIAYGWEFDEKENYYYNSKKEEYVMLNPDTVILTSNKAFDTFDKIILEKGYTKVDEIDLGTSKIREESKFRKEGRPSEMDLLFNSMGKYIQQTYRLYRNNEYEFYFIHTAEKNKEVKMIALCKILK